MRRLAAALVVAAWASTATGAPAAAGTPESDPAKLSRGELWAQIIGGRESFPSQLADLEAWFFAATPRKHPTGTCQAEVRSVLRELDRYGRSAYHSRGRAPNLGESARGELTRLVGKPCFELAAHAYLLGSVWISDHLAFAPDRGTQWGCSAECGRGPPANLFNLLLTRALLKAGFLEFRAPDAECSLEFAYFCGSEKTETLAPRPARVRLDPLFFLKDEKGVPYAGFPQDFAALYYHELDHFYRDKWLTAAQVRARFPDPGQGLGIDWSPFILEDETLATVLAASLEYVSQVTVPHEPAPNQVRADFTLYQKGGPLADLIEAENPHDRHLLTFYDQFLKMTFLRGFWAEHDRPPRDPRYFTDLNEIYGIVRAGVFPAIAPGAVPAPDVDRMGAELEPLGSALAYWSQSTYRRVPVGQVNEADVWRMSQSLRMQIGPFPSFRVSRAKAAPVVVPIRTMLLDIANMVRAIPIVSEVCLGFNARLAAATKAPQAVSDPLAGYLGGSCLGRPGGENGVRTGVAARP